jgi:hypothetical protein
MQGKTEFLAKYFPRGSHGPPESRGLVVLLEKITKESRKIHNLPLAYAGRI